MSTPDAPKKPAAARTAKKRKPAAQPDTRQQSLFTEEAAPVAPKKPAARASAGKSAARAEAKPAAKPAVKPAAKPAAKPVPPAPPRGKKSSLLARLFVLFLVLALLAGGALGAALWWLPRQPLQLAQPVEFTIERGMTLRQAVEEMSRAGIPFQPELLYWAARLNRQGNHIIAGSYVAESGLSPLALVSMIEQGLVATASVRLGEGWTLRQIRAALRDAPYLVDDISALDEATLLARIGAEEKHAEGLFFPDTYRYNRHSSALALLREAYRSMKTHLHAVWNERAPDLPLKNPYEALILASIIEKESGRGDDRARVSAVFNNRLRLGMKLQTDPTVIYGFGEDAPPRLLRRHLETDHPFNTYTRFGLPPTPIASPGAASLAAAVHPENSDYLYFVSRNDGSSEFSRNLADHNRAVNRYQRGKRTP